MKHFGAEQQVALHFIFSAFHAKWWTRVKRKVYQQTSTMNVQLKSFPPIVRYNAGHFKSHKGRTQDSQGDGSGH